MTAYHISFIGIAIGACVISLIIGWLLGYALTRTRWAARLAESQAELHRADAEKTALNRQVEQAEKHREESIRLLKSSFEEQQKSTMAQFESLSSKILADNAQSLKLTNKEQMDALLSPLKVQLEGLGKAVQQTNTSNATNTASLSQMIKQMMEQAERIGHDAVNLTKALKGDSKKQGDWGELVLERMLEESGLKKGEEYYIQQDFATEDGRHMRPDVVVRFPDHRSVIVDSKVSLTAYAAYAASEDEAERQAALAAHVASVRKHIDELAGKDYSSIVRESVGYVLMFIPNEASYIAAVQAQPELPLEGYRKRVLLISPTNLLMALQLAYNLWQKERQTRNIEAIFDKAASIYDKCVGLMDSFDNVGKSLNSALKAYNEAKGRFHSGRGNLTRQVDDLRQMGVNPAKRLRLSEDEPALPES